jgi:nucleoside-diphosphate-sugar epimerase
MPGAPGHCTILFLDIDIRVLLAGHPGYVGSVLAKMLLQAGHDVSGLDSGVFQRNRFVGALANVPCLRRDLRDVKLRGS